MNDLGFSRSSFKARVALAALQGDVPAELIAMRFGVSAKEVQEWRCQLEQRTYELFEAGGRR
ncbi:hypothetical protein ACRYJU_10445 [Alloalcanivorax xenomutans]|uniref:hypothetical protein n=1 Tax=Alloalcanivorax xenomutans TaxID=1094342 RepID=UPI003D9B777A